jgi:hypothetical protein
MKKLFFVIICLLLTISLVWGKTWTSSVVSKSYNSPSLNPDEISFSIPSEIVVDNITKIELIVDYNISGACLCRFLLFI